MQGCLLVIVFDLWCAILSDGTSHDVKDPECVIIWEKKPTPEEERKAKSLRLPPTFFCGVGPDSDTERDKAEDFETELRKVKEALVGETS